VGLVGKQDFDAVIHYVQNLGLTKILSNPKLVVTNNQESRIHVGEKQAYVTSTTTTGQVSNTVSENVTFVDVGIQLSVTPTINSDGFITMKVKAEVSSVSSTLTTPSQNKIPIINSSLAETTVMVKEGVTIVLGGLRQDQRVKTVKQTPFVSSLPFIGNLFKSETTTYERSELMILLTPRLITGEVFVGEAGQKIEDLAIKKQQTYEDAKAASKAEAASAVNSASLIQSKPMLKGIKELP
jgi:general secretion pathway protein D